MGPLPPSPTAHNVKHSRHTGRPNELVLPDPPEPSQAGRHWLLSWAGEVADGHVEQGAGA